MKMPIAETGCFRRETALQSAADDVLFRSPKSKNPSPFYTSMNEKTVFDRMLDTDVRKAFCERKSRFRGMEDAEREALLAYIPGEVCSDDILCLKQGQYFLEPPNRFRIRKICSSKRRICYSHPERDKFLLQLMAYVLLEYDGMFAESLYSFRKNKDHRDFFEILRQVDSQRQYYVLKLDVRAYGESIDQDILLDKLEAAFSGDPEFLAFLRWFVKRNQYYENGELQNERVTVVTGTPIGAFFNNLYLAELDRIVESRAKLYMRFADDIAVFTDTYEEAEKMKEIILSELKRLRLECNAEKTAIYRPGEKFSLLGIEISENGFDIAPESVRKILYKLKKQQQRLLIGIREKKYTPQEAFAAAVQFVNGYFYGIGRCSQELNWSAWAFGIITTTDSLKRIDHCTQDFLRSIKSGKSGNARYRAAYAELRKAGYRSLVNVYYHDHQTETNHP